MLSIFLLAVIQGLSEFFPISSSAHIIILRDIFNIGSTIVNNDIKLTFDIALHFGTAIAILTFFYKDFKNMLFNGIKKGYKEDGKLFWLIITSTIPAALVGVLFEDYIEQYIRTKYILIMLSLIIVGIIIYSIDKKQRETKDLKSVNFFDALLIGLFQIFALIPGFSRSGTTIASARLLKIKREDATKYSFYLSLPIVLGAVLFQIIKMDLNIITNYFSFFVIGILISFIVGLLSIEYLLKYIKNHNFKIFMWYRIIIGTIVLLYLLIIR